MALHWPSHRAVVGGMRPEDLECIRRLGDGAAGSIWLARHRATGQRHALKLLSKARMARGRGKAARALNELDILRASDHPFIVTLAASFQTDEFLCHVLEYCSGGNLYDLLHGGALREPHARFFAAQILSALEYLHFMGYIHRDLKPENILITSVGHIRLADFDLSQVADGGVLQMAVPFNAEAAAQHGALPPAGATGDGQRQAKNPDDGSSFNSFVGTVEYCAPEVIEGTGHSFGVDHWVLGVLIYVRAATGCCDMLPPL